MNSTTVSNMISEKKVIINYKPLKMNSKGIFTLKGAENEYFLDWQLGETGSFVFYTKPTMADSKQKYQTRYKSNVLVRVDLNGSPHMCNDGSLWKNHIHICKGEDAYGQSIFETYKLDDYSVSEFKDLSGWNVFLDFCKVCNIVFKDGANIQGVI